MRVARRPGSLDFVKNNIYFHTLGRRAPLKGLLKYSRRCNVSTAWFSWCAEIYVEDFWLPAGAGTDFLLATGAQNMTQGLFCMCDGPLLSSQVSRPQNPPRRMALINGGAALLDRKDMGGPPHVTSICSHQPRCSKNIQRFGPGYPSLPSISL